MPLRWLAGGAVAATLALAPAAQADTYSVYGCRGPDGTSNAATGWVGNPNGDAVALNTCPEGGLLRAALNPNATGGSGTDFTFTAPADTRIVHLHAQRRTTGAGKPEQPKDAHYALTADKTTLEECQLGNNEPCVADLVDPIDFPGLDASQAKFEITCPGRTIDRCEKSLGVEITQVVMGLRDTLPPTATSPQIVDDGDASGVLRVRFDAADKGGGVYRSLLKVDGQVNRILPLGTGTCTDAGPADADPYQFLDPLPCPASVTGVQVDVDASTLSAAPHTIEMELEDAAGNSQAVYTTQFPRPNVTAAGAVTPEQVQDLLQARVKAWFVKTKTRRLTARKGQRNVIRGELRTRKTGRAVQGARLDVYHLVGAKRERRLIKTGLKTRRAGRFTLILPIDIDTRRVEIAYRALRPGPVTSQTALDVTVRDKKGRVFRRHR